MQIYILILYLQIIVIRPNLKFMLENQQLPPIETPNMDYSFVSRPEDTFRDDMANKLIEEDKKREAEVIVDAQNPTEIVAEQTTSPVLESSTAIVAETPATVVAPVADAPKEWYETDTTQQVATTQAEEDYKTKYEELQYLLQDQQISAVIEARKAGKDLFGFVEEMKGVDVDKMSSSQLFELKLSQYTLTDEQKDLERERFEFKSPMEQQESVLPIKEQLINEQNSRLGQFASTNSHKQAELQAQEQREAQIAINTLSTKMAEITGKEYLGLNITPERADKITETVISYTKRNDDGTFDIDGSIKLAMFMNYDKEIVKANVDKVRSQTVNEIHNEITRPSVESTTSSTTSAKTAQQEQDEAYAAEMAEIIEKQKPIYY